MTKLGARSRAWGGGAAGGRRGGDWPAPALGGNRAPPMDYRFPSAPLRAPGSRLQASAPRPHNRVPASAPKSHHASPLNHPPNPPRHCKPLRPAPPTPKHGGRWSHTSLAAKNNHPTRGPAAASATSSPPLLCGRQMSTWIMCITNTDLELLKAHVRRRRQLTRQNVHYGPPDTCPNSGTIVAFKVAIMTKSTMVSVPT